MIQMSQTGTVQQARGEAYFWVNFAITSEPKTGELSWLSKRQAAKHRADAASHLTEGVRVQIRERGRE